MRYVAMWNLPGCLPEMEPADFDTFEDAKTYIIDALKTQEDAAESEEDAETFCHAAEDVNLESRPFCTPPLPDGYVYSVDHAAE